MRQWAGYMELPGKYGGPALALHDHRHGEMFFGARMLTAPGLDPSPPSYPGALHRARSWQDPRGDGSDVAKWVLGTTGVRPPISMTCLVSGYREKTLTRFPAGSRKIIDRLPQGWVVGGSTHSTPSAATRGCWASTSSTRKSRMTSSGRGWLWPAVQGRSS